MTHGKAAAGSRLDLVPFRNGKPETCGDGSPLPWREVERLCASDIHSRRARRGVRGRRRAFFKEERDGNGGIHARMMDGMRAEPLGEDAWVVRDLAESPWRYVASAEALPGVVEAAACFESLGIWTEAGFDPASLSALEPAVDAGFRTIVVPTVYDGPDLDEAAARLSMSVDALIDLHASTNYRCGAVGFQPGFPYLGPLPAPLDRLPRRDAPRPRIPAGSVAIAAGMTGIYPGESPGGWWLIGRTELPLVRGEETLFRAGDIARFVVI